MCNPGTRESLVLCFAARLIAAASVGAINDKKVFMQPSYDKTTNSNHRQLDTIAPTELSIPMCRSRERSPASKTVITRASIDGIP